MSNPTDVGATSDYGFAIVEATTNAATLTLNANKRYSLRHGSVDTSGSASTAAIFMACNSGSTYSYDSGSNKSFLVSGEDDVEIGPGLSSLGYKASSGAPVFRITPIENVRGSY